MAIELQRALRLVPAGGAPVTAPVSDEPELVRRAQDGVASAQDELFRRHAPRLLPMLIRLLASTADAEDALQDTFMEAFRDLRRLREATAFGGWLRQIAVHRAHRKFRRRRLLAALGLDQAPTDATLEQLVAADASPEVRAQLAQLGALLARLPAKNRVPWVLRYVEGNELTDVAAACDCSLATVKRRIAAAHERIGEHLDLPSEGEGGHE